jgi:hypothetical protein
MERLKKEGRLVTGVPAIVPRKVGKRTHLLLLLPYGASFKFNKMDKERYRHLGTLPIYNLTTRRFLAGFWQFLNYCL